MHDPISQSFVVKVRFVGGVYIGMFVAFSSHFVCGQVAKFVSEGGILIRKKPTKGVNEVIHN